MTILTVNLNWVRNYLPAIVWTGLSYLLLGIPGDLLPHKQLLVELFRLDKILHFLLFFVLFFAIVYGSRRQYNAKVWSLYTLAGIVVTLFVGATSELVQEYIPNRFGSFFDFLADTAGCATAFLVYWFYD